MSEAYFDEHTYEEWREAMGIYAENWEEVEELAEAYEDMLFDLELAKDNGKDNKFSIQFFLEVHAEEKVDKEEMAMLLERADKYNLDPVDMLVANMGISAEKAKKLGRVYWNKETSKATAAKWNDEADKQELRENVLKTTKFIGQGASVVGSVMTFGGLGLLTQVAVVVTNTDTILNMGEQTAVYLLGDKVGKKTFITDIRKYSKIAAPIAALFTFDIKSIKDGANNLSKLYEIVGLGSYVKARTDEMEKGELLGLDISGDQPESKVYEDSKELAKDLEEKGVNLKDETITDDDFEDMDEDSSWIDASEEDQDAYLERRDQKVLVEKADEEEGAKNYEEVEKIYDDQIASDEEKAEEDARDQKRELAKEEREERREEARVEDDEKNQKATNDDEDGNSEDELGDESEDETSDKDDDKSVDDESDKALDKVSEENSAFYDPDPSLESIESFVSASADRMGYEVDLDSMFSMAVVFEEVAKGGYDDLAIKYGVEAFLLDMYYEFGSLAEEEEVPDEIMTFIKEDPFAGAVWEKLESINSVDDTVVDEIMSDIVWTVGGKFNMSLTVGEAEDIFKERSMDLYKEFEDIFEAERNK